MQIWVYLNGIQQGPYSIEQIRLLPIDADTPVWYEGLPQWTPAGHAPATSAIFAPTNPMPAPDTTSSQASQQTIVIQAPSRPSTYLVWNILFTILCCSPASIAGIITGAISSSRYSSGDYAGAKRMSNITEWLLIISLVWVVLSIPISILFSLL